MELYEMSNAKTNIFAVKINCESYNIKQFWIKFILKTILWKDWSSIFRLYVSTTWKYIIKNDEWNLIIKNWNENSPKKYEQEYENMFSYSVF